MSFLATAAGVPLEASPGASAFDEEAPPRELPPPPVHAEAHAPCGSASDPAPLPNGTTILSHIGQGSDTWCYFRLDVAPGLQFLQFDTTSDRMRSMYVKRGSIPTRTSYDCWQPDPTAIESCELRAEGGAWYVGIRNVAWEAGNFTLTATWGVPPVHCVPTELEQGVAHTSRMPPVAGAWCDYTFTVPPGQGSVKFVLADRRSRDLYVRQEGAPTLLLYDCRPYEPHWEERCGFASPEPGTWHLRVRNREGYAGPVTVRATYDPAPWSGCPARVLLQSGVPTTVGMNRTYNAFCYLYVDVPPGAEQLRLRLEGSLDRDVYADVTVPWADFSFPACGEPTDPPNEECWVDEPAPGRWHVAVFNWADRTGPFTITATVGPRAPCGTFGDPHVLELGVSVETTMPSRAGFVCWYHLVVPPGAAVLHGEMRSLDPYRDMSLYWGESFIGQSVIVCNYIRQEGGHDTCTVPALPGTWRVRILNQDHRADALSVRYDTFP